MSASGNVTAPNFTQSQVNWTIYISLLSAIGSSTYCVTYLIFHKEMKTKASYRILYRIFASNFLTSIGSMAGLPSDYGFDCWWEGLMTNIFSLTSVLWTIVISVLLYSIVGFKKPLELHSHWVLHFICWGIPIFVSLLPLTNSTYGPPGGQGWCWIVNNVDGSSPDWAASVWFWVSYYLWIWLSFFLIIGAGIACMWKFRHANAQTTKNFKSAVLSLAGYPLMILICWGPVTVTDYIQYYFPGIPADNYERFLTNLLSTSMGFMQVCCYWLTDEKAKLMWKRLASVGFSLRKYEDLRRSIASGTGSSHALSSTASERSASSKNLNAITEKQQQEKKEKVTVKAAPNLQVARRMSNGTIELAGGGTRGINVKAAAIEDGGNAIREV